MISNEEAIHKTAQWIKQVVIDCRFCPFAALPVKKNTVRYAVERSGDTDVVLNTIIAECEYLEENSDVETTFVILPESYHDFYAYLKFLAQAEKALKKSGYEGTYQIAGFHPEYLFAGSDESDAANYTNRSIYPMVHLLRESSIDEALENYAEPESIPDTNIAFAQKKGVVYMKMLRDAIANA
jgi:hypothetical protein